MSNRRFSEYLKTNIASFYFIILLLGANFVWKLMIHGDDSDLTVTLFGMNISPFFDSAVHRVTLNTYRVLHFFGSGIHMENQNFLIYDNGVSVHLVWSCTAIKQAFIFTLIMLLYRGYSIHKLWYIPLGLIIIFIFNIFRISMITLLIHYHPNWFEILHLYIFKYLFYAVVFGMWVFWEEKLRVKPEKKN